MNHSLFQALGRLGKRPEGRLIYFGLVIQLALSALVFLFDSGFPAWIMAAGWVLLIFAGTLLALKEHRRDKMDEARRRRAWRRRETRITLLKERLEGNPQLQTLCAICRHGGNADNPCLAKAGIGERAFRFHRDDRQSYCLLWDPPQPE